MPRFKTSARTFLIILIFSVFSAVSAPAEELATLGTACVIPEDSTLVSKTDYILETLMSSLYKYGNSEYRFVAREKRDILMLEQYNAISGNLELNEKLAESRFDFPDMLAIASFLEEDGEILIGLQLVDTLNNSVHGAESTRIGDFSELGRALDTISARFFDVETDRNPWPSTILSAIIPGTGQLKEGQTFKGSLMMGGAALLIGGGTYAIIMSRQHYDQSLDPGNNQTETDYYYNLSVTESITAIACAGLYVATGIWSAIDTHRIIKQQNERY